MRQSFSCVSVSSHMQDIGAENLHLSRFGRHTHLRESTTDLVGVVSRRICCCRPMIVMMTIGLILSSTVLHQIYPRLCSSQNLIVLLFSSWFNRLIMILSLTVLFAVYTCSFLPKLKESVLSINIKEYFINFTIKSFIA